MSRPKPIATPYLHGNHDPCAACELRREVQDSAAIFRDPVPCNVCGGLGYLALSDAEIVRRTVEEARRLYWPGPAQMIPEPLIAPAFGRIGSMARSQREDGAHRGAGGKR